MLRSCLPSPCYSTGNVGGPVVVYSASLWGYPASHLSFHTRHGVVAVFGFAVVVSCFALISSRLMWYCCGIWLRCGGILLCPYLFMPSVVLLRYWASRWQYPSSSLSLHAQCGIVAVFGFAVVVFFFALISYLFLQVVVIAPGHEDRDRGLWREIIFDFDLSCFNTTGFVRSSSPYHPCGASIFPDCQRSIRTKEKNKQDRNQGS